MSETNELAKAPGFTPGKAAPNTTTGHAETSLAQSSAPHSLTPGNDEHTAEIKSIQNEIRSIGAWISHRMGFHPAHEAAKQSLEAAVGHLEQALNPSAQAVASGKVTVAGTAPPYNQTSPGALSTSTPGKGPSLEVNV